MKKKKNMLIVLITLGIIIAISSIFFLTINDKNKLTIEERNWLDTNINKVQNINVINNANVFGKNGIGIYYDFLNDFSKYYSIEINPITYNIGSNPQGISLGVKNTLTDNDLVIYKDHYVLISNNNELITDEINLENLSIGIINNDQINITKYLNNLNLKIYNNQEELLNAFPKEVNYIIVPLMEYLDYILDNNYYINYHFSDINIYYTIQKDNSLLSNIIEKYYHKWMDNFNKYFNKQEFNVFQKSLKITDEEVANLEAIEYNYGFVNNSPYEVIMGGEYGGIVAIYLSQFSAFASVDFNFNKYKNFDHFWEAIKKNNIDLYFNYYNLNSDYKTTSGIPIYYTIASRRNNSNVINNINSLKNKEVYVEENSLIYDYIKNISNINIKTYSNQKELFKLNKLDTYIIMDYDSFDYYKDNELDNYTSKYQGSINKKYEFKVYNNDILAKLLDKYMMTLDHKEIRLEGLDNHYETVKIGSIISKFAKYIIYIVLIIIIIALLIIRKSKKIIIARKIKKDDKLKFIDQLTSLKNRNFLNENISVWNNNTIYPQTIIAIDLNKVQEINDIEGYNEGDKQIKAAANALIKTQLDNSEIMRTDGNEFVIYLVGYSQKQVTSYVHKLNKELKKLPYPYGAEFGYSMIIDDIKTIEDALNEAMEQIKKQKSD